MRLCAKCKYVRQATDTAPDWQCPACQVAYVKALDAAAGREIVPESRAPGAPESSLRFVTWGLLALLVVAFAGYGMVRNGQQRKLSSTRIEAPGTSSAEGREAQPQVVLYATSWCGYCKATREFFAENGIRYTEYDIESSDSARAEHARLGGRGIPLIVVGEEVLRGYNPQALNELLGPWISR